MENRLFKYIVQVEGGDASTVFHENYIDAREEAIRLAKKMNKNTIVAEVVISVSMEPVVNEVGK